MIARIILLLFGLLLLGAGSWLLLEYPIGIGWFGWGEPDGGEVPDFSAQLSAITQVGLASLVIGGSLVGAAVGFALGRRQLPLSRPES